MSTHERILRFPRARLFLSSSNYRVGGIYLSGALLAVGLFILVDAAAFSHSALNGSDIHVTFVDWISGISSTIGTVIINSVDKARITADVYTYTSSGVAWRAKLILFMGFAFLAGGLAGSVTIMTLKYLIHQYPFPTLWFGIANFLANSLMMLSTAMLWVVQNMDDEYTYNVAL